MIRSILQYEHMICSRFRNVHDDDIEKRLANTPLQAVTLPYLQTASAENTKVK